MQIAHSSRLFKEFGVGDVASPPIANIPNMANTPIAIDDHGWSTYHRCEKKLRYRKNTVKAVRTIIFYLLFVLADKPFNVTLYHDGLLMPTYRWSCDGVSVKTFNLIPTFSTTTSDYLTDDLYAFTVEVPGLPVGSHSCHVSAFNDLGEAIGPEIDVVAVGPPKNVRVIR